MTTMWCRWTRAAVGAVLLAGGLGGCDRETRDVAHADYALADREAVAGRQTDALVSAGDAATRIGAYELTTERVERWFVAQENVDALLADDPALEYRLREARGASGDRRPIEGAVARLRGAPEVRAAIEDAGLRVDDFVMTGLALHQALLAAGRGASPDLRRAAARNVRFVTANANLLQRFANSRRSALAYAEPEPYDTLWDAYDGGVDTTTYLGDVGDADDVGDAGDVADVADGLWRDSLSVGPMPVDSVAGVRVPLPEPARDSAALRPLPPAPSLPPVRVPVVPPPVPVSVPAAPVSPAPPPPLVPPAG